MAQEIADSKLLDTWGSGGAKIEPDITKIIEGWQLGEQPPHEYMNWLQNTFGSKLNHILKNGVASWNVKTEYLAGATVQRNGNVWICQETNVNSEPTELNNNWDKIPSIENLALTVDTIDDFPISATTGDTCIVKDLDRGGIFIYDSTKVSEHNGGTNFNGWIRQYNGVINVKWFGAKGDGVTSSQIGIVTAVATAYAIGTELEWPAGTYVSDANIPGFHSVRHTGLGVIKRSSSLYFIEPKLLTHKNTIYVNGSYGSNSFDGLSPEFAVATISTAFSICQGISVLPVISDGAWRIKIAPGTYNEAAAWTSAAQVKTWFEVEGELDGDGAPAVFINGTGVTANGGLYFQQGPLHIKVSNIQSDNFRSSSVSSGFVFDGRGIDRAWIVDCRATNNLWSGVNADSIGQFSITGGEYKGNTQYQVRARGGIGLSIGAYSSTNRIKIGDGTGVAMQIRDACTGHVDYVDFEDTATGLQVTNVSRVTIVDAAFSRCTIGWTAGACSTVAHDTSTTFESVSLKFQLTQNAVFGQDSSTNEGGEGLEYYPFTDRYTTGKRKWSTTKNPSPAAAHAWCTGRTGAVDYNYLVPTGASVRLSAGDDTDTVKQYLHFDLPNSRTRAVIENVACWTTTQDLFVPGRDNMVSLGNASARWSQLYVLSGTINTSDDREKTYLNITEIEKQVALELKANMKKFKFNDAIKIKGEKARIHFGASAQTVKSIFENYGLNGFDYAILCYDEWEKQEEVKDEEGVITQEYRLAGNRYGIRYEELLCFIISAM